MRLNTGIKQTTGRRWSRVLVALLCLCVAVSLSACGDGSATSSETGSEISGETTKTPTKKPATTTAATTSSATGSTTAGTTAVTQQTTQKQTTTTTQASSSAYAVTTKKEPVLSHYTLKASEYIKNPQVHSSRYLSDTEGFAYAKVQGFFVDSQNYLLRKDDLTELSLEYYGFNIYQAFPYNMGVGEWVFSFLQLKAGSKMGDNRVLLPSVQYGTGEPKNRPDALKKVKNWIWEQFKEEVAEGKPWHSMNGYYLWNHYAGEWGAAMIGSETGETIGHTQASIAFTRGAGRQYNVPTFIDFSEWFGGIPGHSPSLVERTAMASFMGGTSFVVAEGGTNYAVCNYREIINGQAGEAHYEMDGDYRALSASGKKYKSVIDFAAKYPHVGTAYTPFGIVMDYYHGIRARETGFGSIAFGRFAYTAGDWMTFNLVDMFFPGGWTQNLDETTYMVNGPYGDTCDTLLQNASQEVLNSYPCLILTGDIKFSGEEKNRYVNYVKQGGTLVMNTAYLNYFTDYKNQYGVGTGVKELMDGSGRVIVYGPDYSLDALDGIIREQLARFVPFTVSEQVEYLVNVKDGTMYVTLINNDGISKAPSPKEVAKIDPNKKKGLSVTVNYTGGLTPKSIKEVYKGAKITATEKGATVTVKPGEVRVLEFQFD